MKNFRVFIFVILTGLFAGCGSISNKSDKAVFVEEFKMNYVRYALKYGFQNSAEIKAILKIDGSTSSELILGNAYAYIDSVAKAKNSDLIKIHPEGTIAEGATGNAVLKKILDDYNSIWLDSLAREAYRKFN